ncbi:MAG: hypothetical protein EA380_02555 [Phycisphaeraceae bacterium]|nr:MAG: hypothetical protein EA380_02555 [Phycisphaeraceae bacterium]
MKQQAASDQRRGPIGWVVDLFSSVWLGISLFVILFVYSAVGSAGVVYPTSLRFFDASVWRHDMIRQWRIFEMTEFEWFHTWFFYLVCGLLTVNIIVTTLRRIPLKVINLGVWTIHTGVVVLIVGSVVYFARKVEGDTPVIRRAVHIEMPDGGVTMLPVVSGAMRSVETSEGVYRFSIASIEPERLEGGFGAVVSVTRPDGERLVQEVVDGAGVRSGRGLGMRLGTVAQEYFWVKDSSALAVRRAEGGRWAHRPIRGLPRYNDTIGSVESVWPALRGQPAEEISGATGRVLDLPVSVSEEWDVLGDVDVRVTGFLRYAIEQSRLTPAPSGERKEPVAVVELGSPGRSAQRAVVAAYRPEQRMAFDGMLAFSYAESEAEAAELLSGSSSRLYVALADGGVSHTVALDDERKFDVFIALGDSGWEIRVDDVIRDLPVDPVRRISLAMITVRTPEGEEFVRWVADRAEDTRDLGVEVGPGMHQGDPASAFREVDERLVTRFSPGVSSRIIVVAGPGREDLRAMVNMGGGAREHRMNPGESIEFPSGATLRVVEWSPHAVEESRPLIVPRNQRDRDADTSRLYAMVRVEMRAGEWQGSAWVPFHRYSFDDDAMATPRLTRWEPVAFDVPGVGEVEVIFTRERRPLGLAVELDEFILTSQFGGFTGETASIRDWTSVIRFDEAAEMVRVSTNAPAAEGGWWFFQAYWDPPSEMSFFSPVGGMSFTGLGVGNRDGVYTQLAGGTLTVLGMMYAFYVKPILKRRQRERIAQDLAESSQSGGAA